MSDDDLAVLFKELWIKESLEINPRYEFSEFAEILLKDMHNFLFLVYQAGANH